ncbi:MAG: hypothetical protein FJ147_09950 [Deltaproteobacteria bacterium]|nr:hypothetical protein [Deltaproteobacteria bacterium]
MATKAKGKKPTFFADPQVDKLMAIVMALAGEVSVLRERLDTVERLVETKGLFARQEVETYRASESVTEEREQWRSQYIARVLRVVREELDAVERGEVTPESYEAVVQAVSS